MKRISLLALFAPLTCFASPFLTSNPQCYDASNARAECPSGYEYSEDGTTWFPLNSDNDGVQIWVYHDVSGLPDGVSLAWQIRAFNVWGVSPEVNFTFDTGVPVSPTGLRLMAP